MSVFYIAAHALIKNEDGKVLVLKRSSCNDYMPLTWDIPGGTVELGETVEEALIRELKEETGILIRPLYPIYAFSNLSQLPYRQTVQLVYLCEYQEGNIILNPSEHEDYAWVDYDSIHDLKCIAFLEGLIHNYSL